MTATLITFNVTDTEKAIAIGKGLQNDLSYETVAVLAESDGEGLTGGQIAFKHNVPKGTGPGTYS